LSINLERGAVRQLAQSDISGLEHEIELRGLSFNALSLVGHDFSDRVIEDCSFRDCVLTDSRFNAATIRACEFAGASMQGVSLFAATIEECKMMGLDFSRGTRFDAVTLTRVNLDYALLRNVDLSDVEFTGCSMRQCDLTGANLSHTSLIDCDLTDADWAGAATLKTDLRGSRTRGLDLRRGPYGVVVTTRQAVGLVENLGVTVIDPAE
jgi:uncharacterized protein YjbI with pentapeptide repeats